MWQILGWEMVEYNTTHSACPEPDTVQFNPECTMLWRINVKNMWQVNGFSLKMQVIWDVMLCYWTFSFWKFRLIIVPSSSGLSSPKRTVECVCNTFCTPTCQWLDRMVVKYKQTGDRTEIKLGKKCNYMTHLLNYNYFKKKTSHDIFKLTLKHTERVSQ